MTNAADPYRVLGLAAGAPLDDVKRAYRRLAKQYHPDSAGGAATARFLAIHAAYESIVSAQPPAPVARRPTSRPAPGARPAAGAAGGMSEPGSGGAGGAHARASQADPERARATRDAYARYRPGRTGERASGTWRPGASRAPGSGGGGPSAAGGGAGAPPGDGRRAAGEASRAEGPERSGRRSVRKARLGSTSYDDAEARDPQWGGATWYGQASGTYWTINPKEYADPRKHGPEYQARARRGSANDTEGRAEAPASATSGAGTEAGGGEASWTWSGTRARTSRAAETPSPPAEGWPTPQGPGGSEAGATATTTKGGAPTSGATATRAPTAATAAPAPTAATAAPAPTAATATPAPTAATATPITPQPAGSPEHGEGRWHLPLPRRVAAALVAWPVIGLAAAGLAGNVTGCARFAASCGPGADLVPTLLQPAILALLLLVPRFAEVAAVGTLAVVLAAAPAAVLLSATGGSRAPTGEAPAALLVILALAWAVGVIAAAAGRARLPGPTSGR